MTKPTSFNFGHLAAFVATLLLSGCTYEYKLLVRVFDSSGEPAVVNVRVVVMTKAIEVDDLPELVSDPVGSVGEVEISLCCSPNPQVWVYAFVDENTSEHWDSGERLKSAQNPLLLNDDATLDLQFD